MLFAVLLAFLRLLFQVLAVFFSGVGCPHIFMSGKRKVAYYYDEDIGAKFCFFG
jgi:hypothetical protein